MSEEKQPITPSPAEEKAPSRGQQRRSQRSVFQYLAILFAAAFVLLLITFAMERRQFEILQEQTEEQIDDLQQSSVTAVNSLNNIIKENEELKEQVAELEQEVAALEGDRDLLIENTGDLEQTITARDKAIQALDWFWQINEAYVRGRYTRCRELIQSIEDAGLVGYLPQESITDNGRFSPYHRYQEIKQALD